MYKSSSQVCKTLLGNKITLKHVNLITRVYDKWIWKWKMYTHKKMNMWAEEMEQW